jgi:hypothetical protein
LRNWPWRGFVETIGDIPCKFVQWVGHHKIRSLLRKSEKSLLEMMDLLREENLSALDDDLLGLKLQNSYGRNRESPLRGSQKTKNRQD